MAETRKIVVVGATGLIGKALCAEVTQRGFPLVVFSRDPDAARSKAQGAVDYVAWQPEESGEWAGAIDGAWAVVNMSGEPLFVWGKRWTYEGVAATRENKVRGITGLVAAIRAAKSRPQVFIQASSMGYYGFDHPTNDEIGESASAGADFWGKDSAAWEAAALPAEQLGVRTVLMRTSYVLDSEPGGGLWNEAQPFRRGFGGWVRPGNQWKPWIHLQDVAALILFALENEQVRGGLNTTAPEVPSAREFAQTLARVLGKRAWMRQPQFVLRMGFGVVAEIVLRSRRLVPQNALTLGYQFRFPTLDSAIRDLLITNKKG